MARASVITYEQVAAVANALYSQGVRDPGATLIRAELAKRAGPGAAVGSPNTIQRHLTEWRAKARPLEVADVPQLPAQLAADISRALVAASSVAREKGEERLAQLQAELDELVVVGEAAENRLDELAQEVAARTSERDSMAGQLAQRVDEVTELKAALAAANERSVTLERALHTAQSEAQAANGRVDEIRQSTERQFNKLQAEGEQARKSQTVAERAAVDAEKRAVAAEAHLASERAAKAVLDAHVAELQDSLKRVEGDGARAAAAEASAAGLREQVTLLTQTLSMMRSLLEAAGKPVPHVPTGVAGESMVEGTKAK
jgi:chromosome segregation ATPase